VSVKVRPFQCASKIAAKLGIYTNIFILNFLFQCSQSNFSVCGQKKLYESSNLAMLAMSEVSSEYAYPRL